MPNKKAIVIFESHPVRRLWDEKEEKWYFSVIDIIAVLIDQKDFQATRNYWKVLKSRLNKEGNETVTKCNRLKMLAQDGKMRKTDVADVETLLRLIQSVPSPKSEPIKLWLALTVGGVFTKNGKRNGGISPTLTRLPNPYPEPDACPAPKAFVNPTG